MLEIIFSYSKSNVVSLILIKNNSYFDKNIISMPSSPNVNKKLLGKQQRTKHETSLCFYINPLGAHILSHECNFRNLITHIAERGNKWWSETKWFSKNRDWIEKDSSEWKPDNKDGVCSFHASLSMWRRWIGSDYQLFLRTAQILKPCYLVLLLKAQKNKYFYVLHWSFCHRRLGWSGKQASAKRN